MAETEEEIGEDKEEGAGYGDYLWTVDVEPGADLDGREEGEEIEKSEDPADGAGIEV